VAHDPNQEIELLSKRVAENLKAVRTSRGLTLDELSARCGVSRGTLSQIETARTNPTVAVLWKIASGLGVPFSTLIGEETASDVKLVKIADQDVIRSADGAFESRPLSPGKPLRHAELYELTLEPGAVHRSDAHPAGTTECLVVIEGEVVIETGDRPTKAPKRHALFFAADVPHAYKNPGSKPARALNVIIYD
jgi:transcriptional regulator with XRE-family HTH domain